MKKIFLFLMVSCVVAVAFAADQPVETTSTEKKQPAYNDNPCGLKLKDVMWSFLSQVLPNILSKPGVEPEWSDFRLYISDRAFEQTEDLKQKGEYLFDKDEHWEISSYRIQGDIEPNREFVVVAKGRKFPGYHNTEKMRKQTPMIKFHFKYFKRSKANPFGFEVTSLEIIKDKAAAQKLWNESKEWPKDFQENY